MNHTDSIINLAQNNGKTCRPLREEEVLEKDNIPYFEVYRDMMGPCGYNIKYYNYESHDNEPRMSYYCDYLLKNIFPNVNSQCDLTGYYMIELHDSYSYLNNKKCYDNVLTFAKNKKDKHPVLIPDPFQIGNYGGRLSKNDPVLWNAKKDKIGFYGVTTGNRNPLRNERLKLCKWSINNRDISDFYITRIAQIEPKKVLNAYPEFKEMYTDPVDQEKQYSYRYLLSADGNTCSYDRLCWIMKSKSVLFKYESNDILWYYPLLLENTHFASVTTDTIRKKYDFYQNNPTMAQIMVANSNQFIKTFITPINTMLYTTYLFENIAENK
jgi:hypothetical protein